MLSSRKKCLIKVLKVSIIAIVFFITISMIATKVVYDSIFKRFDVAVEEMQQPAEADCVVNYSHRSYLSGKNGISGHMYKTENAESIIVIVPGFHADIDQFVPHITAFCENGFDVFIFDSTGHGNSQGETSVGFPQMVKDLDATLDYIASEEDYDDIYLFGHSRGGYAACCALKDKGDMISKVVAVNGVDSAMDALMAYSTVYVGKLAYVHYPFLNLYQSGLFGSELAGRSAAECISESDVPVLIIQSKNDPEVRPDEFSIYSHREEITSPSVSFRLYDKAGKDGHTSILFDGNGSANADIVEYAVDFFKNND